MFAAIGAIKALLVTPENRRKFIALEGLEAIIRIKDAIIIDATQQDDPDAARKPKDQRIQYEAARTLAVLTEEESARDEIVRLGGVGLLHFLLDSSFEILQNEGLKALRHLVNHKETESRPKLVEDGLIDVVLNGLTKTKSDDVVLGLVALLSTLADNGTSSHHDTRHATHDTPHDTRWSLTLFPLSRQVPGGVGGQERGLGVGLPHGLARPDRGQPDPPRQDRPHLQPMNVVWSRTSWCLRVSAILNVARHVS
jgi:hypothetical protein